MTITEENHKGGPPPKMIKVNGIMKLNPEYKLWKERQDGTMPGSAASAPPGGEVAVTGMWNLIVVRLVVEINDSKCWFKISCTFTRLLCCDLAKFVTCMTDENNPLFLPISADAGGVPMVAASYAPEEPNPTAYNIPTSSSVPQQATVVTTTTYTIPPPQQTPNSHPPTGTHPHPR